MSRNVPMWKGFTSTAEKFSYGPGLLGFLKRVLEDDVYNGTLFPQGRLSSKISGMCHSTCKPMRLSAYSMQGRILQRGDL